MNNFLLIEGCNFIDRPIGGQLSFTKQIIQVYGNEVYLVGVTDKDDIKIGEWTKIIIDNIEYDFFPFRKLPKSTEKPLIPARISDYIAIRKYKKEILSKNKNALTQAPELLLAMKDWEFDSLCYEFPGVENPLEMPRFKWGKILAKQYEKKLFNVLSTKVDLILASAGEEAINNLIKRSNGLLTKEKVFQFPTRVDTNFFKPININKKDYGLDENIKILVTCGRINQVKGWELIIDSFNELIKNDSTYRLFFIGDGEDRKKLEEKINNYSINPYVKIIGFQSAHEVLKWTNLADIILVGSFKEGWSISMLEALACGKPIISTNVSGAKEMIINRENGFIVKDRNPNTFAKYIKKTNELKNSQETSLNIVKKYALNNLKKDLDNLWER